MNSIPHKKYKVLLNDLREKIKQGQYIVGNKIPTVRKLSKLYHVCPNTAYRAIKELQKDGLVEIMPGSKGVYCRKNIDKTRWQQGDTFLFMLNKDFFKSKKYYGDLFLTRMIASAQEELDRHGYKIVFHCMEGDAYENRFIELASNTWIAGVFITSQISSSSLNRISELSIPKVAFNVADKISNITNYILDYRLVIRETLKLFKKKQFKRICLYPGLEDAHMGGSAPFTYCHEILEKLAPIYGFPPDKIIIIKEVYPKNEDDTPEKFNLPLRKDASWESLGIFTTSSTFAKQLLDAIRKTDLVFGKDIGLIGINDYLISEGKKENFSTWDTEPEKLGEQIADELIESHKNPNLPYSIIRYSGRYINRGTS